MSFKHLTLVMPGLSKGISLLKQGGHNIGLLEKFLYRAECCLITESDEALAFKLLADYKSENLPIAQVTAIADGFENKPTWLRADPVELVVDLTHVFMSGRRHLTLTQEELIQLQLMINPLLKEFDLELIFSSAGRGYLCCKRTPKLQTTSPDAIIGKSISEFLPRGCDQKFWLRLMTEIQMLLHECELNKKRWNQGLPTVDALWFWGQGAYNHSSSISKPYRVISDDEVVLGLANILNFQVEAFTQAMANFTALPYYNSGDRVLIWSSQMLNLKYIEGLFLEILTKQIYPVLKAIHDRKITTLELYPGDKHCYYITSNVLRTWWKPWSRK